LGGDEWSALCPDHFTLRERDSGIQGTEGWVGQTARIGIQRGENFYSLPEIVPRLFCLSARRVVIVYCVNRMINSEVDGIALCPFLLMVLSAI